MTGLAAVAQTPSAVSERMLRHRICSYNIIKMNILLLSLFPNSGNKTVGNKQVEQELLLLFFFSVLLCVFGNVDI